MKKLTSVLCALAMVLALCAAGAPAAFAADTYEVGVCQLVQHPALDLATEGFQQALKDKLGDQVKVNVQNASGDSATCSTICSQFASDGVDLIMANATAALQAAASVTGTIPILGTSVTDYASALEIEDWSGATGLNISGTSDLAPLDGQAAIVAELFPDAKTVGILYCSAEPNSKFQAETITPFLEESGFKVSVFTFADSNEVASVTQNAVSECDVLYIPTDNTAASCAEAINNVALPAGVPIVTGEESLCKGCGVATLSISYYDLGYATGEMAVEVLVNGADVSTMPIQYAPKFTKEFNAEICEKLGITPGEDYVAIPVEEEAA